MAQIHMTRRSEYEDWSTLKRYLGIQMACGSSALVLGAGMSADFGLPTWDDLITRLYAAHGASPPAKDPRLQAEAFADRFYPGDQAGFISEVRDALYKTVDVGFESLRSNHCLAALAAMLMGAGPSTMTEVITFNWDDLLEHYLEFNGYIAIPVYEERFWATSADVVTYHPHGFLPYFRPSVRSTKVIFDQYSYTEIMGSETLWKQTILHSFRTTTCILIGLSGEDPNLDMALVRSGHDHASKSENTLFWGVCFTTDKTSRARWEKRGIYPVMLSNYDELPHRLFDIAHSAASARSGRPSP